MKKATKAQRAPSHSIVSHKDSKNSEKAPRIACAPLVSSVPLWRIFLFLSVLRVFVANIILYMKFCWMAILFLSAACAFKITAEEKVSGPIPKNTESTKTGVVTGKVTFGPLQPGPEREGDTPEPEEIAEKMYELHKVGILNEDGEKLIRDVSINKKGIYKVELPPGKYILQITPGSVGRFRQQPIKAEVIAGKTLQVDISIDTGLR